MSTPRPLRFRMSIGMIDFIAGVMLVVGTIILVNGSTLAELEIKPSANPGRDIALLLAFPALFAIVFGISTRAERRCADDFAFQLLATSAMVGMFSMIAVNSLWAIDALRDAIGVRGLRGPDMMAIGQIGWGASYVAFRIRGGVQ